MLKWLLKKGLQNRYLYNLARQVRTETTTQLGPEQTGAIPEITPFDFCPSTEKAERINLMVPALSQQHVFGGIATALRFFKEVAGGYETARIIVTDESSVQLPQNEFFSDWTMGTLDQEEAAGNSIVVAGNRHGKKLPVSRNDFFVATAWWTAFNAFRAVEWQQAQYAISQRKLIYLVQDYEPGFYPWSARFALADSTYRRSDTTIPVFNTRLLYDFFHQQNYDFDQSFYFEPIFNPILKKLKTEKEHVLKKKQLLVYGRPSVERNLFPILVQALRRWAEKYETVEEWEIISAGEAHEEVELSNTKKLRSVGKVSLDEYATILAETSVGVSLMLSPHPSYPPLEMAMYGVNVITNKYANKDLSLLSPVIQSVDSLDPDRLADEIERSCQSAQGAIEQQISVKDSSEINCQNLFNNSDDSEFGFVNELILQMQSQSLKDHTSPVSERRQLQKSAHS